jgi:RNase H-fold protein (predicted Holliday junction resolvase)
MQPGANSQMIVNTSTKIMGKLTKKDLVVVWGGTRDVGRNETEKGLHQIRNFEENHKQTNVLVMSVPCRYDLESNSCVNDEVKVYNRKLKKHLKVFDNMCVLKVDTDRDLFTRHGLHMNLKGKEQIAGKIVMTIKAMLNEKKNVPIKMKYKEDLGRDNTGTEGKPISVETETGQEN